VPVRAAADLAHHCPSQYLPLPTEKELEFLNTEELVKIGFANREDLWRALPPNSAACATRRSRLPLAHSARPRRAQGLGRSPGRGHRHHLRQGAARRPALGPRERAAASLTGACRSNAAPRRADSGQGEAHGGPAAWPAHLVPEEAHRRHQARRACPAAHSAVLLHAGAAAPARRWRCAPWRPVKGGKQFLSCTCPSSATRCRGGRYHDDDDDDDYD